MNLSAQLKTVTISDGESYKNDGDARISINKDGVIRIVKTLPDGAASAIVVDGNAVTLVRTGAESYEMTLQEGKTNEFVMNVPGRPLICSVDCVKLGKRSRFGLVELFLDYALTIEGGTSRFTSHIRCTYDDVNVC
ncbi:MAG: DUF1934 domain-containing protein [Clostridiales bacterium]|jgi:hypothetical protein|nr:DUF1934 domain-containing protein [Clostridiales bacterium]